MVGQQNPANALKTLVHRTRAVLDEMIPGGGKLIAGSHSSYAFIESDECVIDSTKFKEYIDKTEDESLSRTRRISMYKKAIALYNSGYLAGAVGETWVQPINVYFHALYNSAVDKCAQLLYPMGKFSEIITLCERATMLDQSDEKCTQTLSVPLSQWAITNVPQSSMIISVHILWSSTVPHRALTSLSFTSLR